VVGGTPGAQQEAGDVHLPALRAATHAMSEHVVIAPENDAERRRHAHAECVGRARKAGTFKTYDDWRATQPRQPSFLQRYLRRR
jgi:hypothetical protein